MPKRRHRRSDKSATRISLSGIWSKYDVLRTLRGEIIAALLPDDLQRDGSKNNVSVYKAMLDPIDSELDRLRNLSVGVEATSREEIRQKAQILRDALESKDKTIVLPLAKSLADDIVSRL
ncbi:MAG: hypothetical protein ACR2PA_22260 [Hyphomicrobiaceae bacterium]